LLLPDYYFKAIMHQIRFRPHRTSNCRRNRRTGSVSAAATVYVNVRCVNAIIEINSVPYERGRARI